MAENLENKVVLITGASSGIGKALATRLSEENVKLVLLSRSGEKLQDIAHQLSAKGSVVSCFSCNVTDIQQIKNAIEYVMEAYGTIDVLINCGAIWNADSPEYYTEQKVRELFDVNSIGIISLTQEILPIMKRNHSGQIVNIVSMAGIYPYKDSGIYSATKFAVRGYTESLQAELRGSGVKVSGIYPGDAMDAELFNTIVNSMVSDDQRPHASKIAHILIDMLKQPDDILVSRLEIQSVS